MLIMREALTTSRFFLFYLVCEVHGCGSCAPFSDGLTTHIEALASGEDLGEVTITCGQYDGPCWKEIRDENERPTGKCEWSGYQLDTCYPANH